MEEKLQQLFETCISELKSIDIEFSDIGIIDIKMDKRSLKRYGCCKQEDPVETSKYFIKRGRRIKVCFNRFNKHHIEISSWVMQLDDLIIKNTIIHEIIHCFPGCNNHGVEFKKYANYINEKLGYNIQRLGNKEQDFKFSNIELVNEKISFNHKIKCKKCGIVFFRKRLKKDLIKKYRCGKCNGKLEIEKII